MLKPGGLMWRGRSSSAFQGGETGHLLRRLSIAISPCSGAWTGEYNVKEIKLPIFFYEVYLFETRRHEMLDTIPHEELGLFACSIVTVRSVEKPLETSRIRLECRSR